MSLTAEQLRKVYGPNAQRYRDFIIYLGDWMGWEYQHQDYDGPEDNRAGHARTLQDAKDDIDERFYETSPIMLCEHCGRDENSAKASGHNFCLAPFDQREHEFTKPHPYLTKKA